MRKTGRLMVVLGVVALVCALAESGKAQSETLATSDAQGKTEDASKGRSDVTASSSELAASTFVDLGHGVRIEFVLIPPGSFMMGSETGSGDEKPVHKVSIAKPFYLGKYEVTQAQWQAVMGSKPSRFKGDSLPVEQVTWDDCRKFVRKVGQRVRLPSETEWEYACRAGSTSAYYWGDSMDDRCCWYDSNSGRKTHPVGQKQPNQWGLFDMSGNVWEWCQDPYHDNYVGAPEDERVWELPTWQDRVLRGGSWGYTMLECRSSARCVGDSWPYESAYAGFRLARNP